MGFPVEVFIDQDHAKQLTCAICLDVFDTAVSICEVGHHYCRACVADVERCPECRADVELLHRVPRLNQEIAAMQVRCEPEDVAAPRCSWQGALSERQAHCTSCPTFILRRQVVDLQRQLQAAQAEQARANQAHAERERAMARQAAARPDASIVDTRVYIRMITADYLRLDCRATTTVAELKQLLASCPRQNLGLEEMYLVIGGRPLTDDAKTLRDVAGAVSYTHLTLPTILLV